MGHVLRLGGERSALRGCSALEMGILAGDLKPGAPGWTKTQKEITSAWLTAPNAGKATAFEGIRARPSAPRRDLLA